MTGAKILEVIDDYQKQLEETGIEKARHPKDQLLTSDETGLQHCHWMTDEIKIFIAEGRIEKAFRWLGFIQGFLWAQSAYTLSELADHNKTDERS